MIVLVSLPAFTTFREWFMRVRFIRMRVPASSQTALSALSVVAKRWDVRYYVHRLMHSRDTDAIYVFIMMRGPAYPARKCFSWF